MRFIDTLASEWIKLTTLRSTYVTLGLGVTLSVAITALASLAAGNTWGESGPPTSGRPRSRWWEISSR